MNARDPVARRGSRWTTMDQGSPRTIATLPLNWERTRSFEVLLQRLGSLMEGVANRRHLADRIQPPVVVDEIFGARDGDIHPSGIEVACVSQALFTQESFPATCRAPRAPRRERPNGHVLKRGRPPPVVM